MTPDILARLGRLLYGSRWASDLARGLDVTRESVVSWAAGRYVPSRARTEAARALVKARIAELRELLGKL